jgi:hypothetical protein
MSNTQLRELLQHLDANGDGVVDAGEFLDAMRRHEQSMGTPLKGSDEHYFDSTPGSNSRIRRDSPIRSLRRSRVIDSNNGSPSRNRRHREELMGGGGGSLLSPSRLRRASYSPGRVSLNNSQRGGNPSSPGKISNSERENNWKR